MKDRLLSDCIYMECPEQAESRPVVALGAGGGGEEDGGGGRR